MPPITLHVKTRSGRTITTLDVEPTATISDVKKRVHSASRKLYPARQRLTLPPKDGERSGLVLEDSRPVSSYEQLKVNGDVILKDLGPQVGYRTVFLLEYAGPLAIYPLFYLFPSMFYSQQPGGAKYPVQTLALAFWTFHYAKRILETIYVHKFHHATMPIFNLYRNCAYYWIFAAFVAYFVNHPLYTPPAWTQSVVCLALAFLSQVANFRCHLILANLRKGGDTGYKIPRGFLFEFITCPNYTTEFLAWLLYSIGVQAVAPFVFTLAGLYQMSMWAIQKHKRLRKVFNGQDGSAKYPKRWIMLPPVF